MAEGASVPALGLSNKAVYSSDSKSLRTESKGNNDYSESYFAPQILTGLCFERLWITVCIYISYFVISTALSSQCNANV